MVGKTISHYHILEKLGEGGMGIVYKAQDTTLKRLVALKFLKPQAIYSEEEKARFFQEARAAAALDHPAICTIYEISEIDNFTFIAMSFIEGQTLEDKLKSGPLAVEEAAQLTLQIARGLQLAHNKGIVHRDIKSANIMVTHNGQAKIMDFGIAHLEGGQALTKTGTPVGTPSYMSPEQIKGKGVDVRSDIFALGILFYEMITGHLPFTGEQNLAIMHSILYDDPLPPATFGVTMPRDIHCIIQKAIEKNPAHRYQSTFSLVSDLENVQQGVTLKPRHKIRKRKPYLIPRFVGIAFVAILLVAIIGFSARHFVATGFYNFDKNSIAIMYFDNLSNNNDLDWQRRGFAELLATYLQHEPELRVTDLENLNYYVQQAGLDQEKHIPLRAARKIAQQLKAGTLITGHFLQNQDKSTVAIKLYDMNTKKFVAGEYVEMTTPDDMFNCVANLADRVKAHLQISQLNVAEYVVDELLYTTSVQALKSHTIGMSVFTESRFAEALGHFQSAIRADSTFIMPYLLASICATATGQDSLARAIHSSLKLDMEKITPKEELLYRFSEAELNRDNEKLKKIVLEIIKMEPRNAGHKLHLAVVYQRLNQPEKAIAPLEEALRIDQHFDQIYLMLGWAYEGTKQYDKALKIYKQCLKVFPDYFWVLIRLAREYHRRGRFKDEQKTINHLVTVCRQGRWPIFDCYYHLGQNYADQGYNDRAIKFFTQAIEIDSTYAYTYLRLGRAYYSIKDWSTAVENFQRCIDLDSSRSEAFFETGQSYEKLEQFQLAVDFYHRFLSQQTEGPQVEQAQQRLEFLHNQGEGIIQ